MKLVIFISLMAARLISATPSPAPDVLFRELFSPIDSISGAISGCSLKASHSRKYVDSTIKDILDKNQLVQGMLLLDSSGVVIKNSNRTGKTIAIQDVASRDWFTIPRTGQIPFFGGIVRANSNNCLLKSYPLSLKTGTTISNGVLVVLVDAARFLEQFKLQYHYPFTVTYKSVKLYRSSPENTDLPSHATISGYDNLEISYRAEAIAEPASAPPAANRKSIASALFSTPLLLLYIGITLLLGFISFFFGRHYRNQDKYRKLLEMEYEKISKEQQKQIHDRALSQVYCEVKRQIETHEIKNIEDEIRHKIEHDIEEKILVH